MNQRINDAVNKCDGVCTYRNRKTDKGIYAIEFLKNGKIIDDFYAGQDEILKITLKTRNFKMAKPNVPVKNHMGTRGTQYKTIYH